ncbi:MAG: sugar transferase [Pseudomonadota bacterium]
MVAQVGATEATRTRHPKLLRVALKRAFDLIASGGALVLLSPFLLVIGLLIRLDGGPALFAQRRIGRDGRVFHCLKFRTMAEDAEARLQTLLDDDPALAERYRIYKKLDVDPRITEIGAFLRKTSLDELPQLLNVITGEMSLIGPRPMMENELDDYGPAFAEYRAVRPGITGLWQVSGRNTTTFAERARLDQRYVQTWSLLGDLRILALTVREVVAGSGR